MRVLVVEDNAEVARQLKDTLERELFVVDVAGDGEKGWFMGDTEAYDAVILDLGLPKLDGLTVLQRWRQGGNHVPVLLLTSRDTWREKVQGLKAGADDYLVKPFSFSEVLARIQALIRRATRVVEPTTLTVADIRMDLLKKFWLLWAGLAAIVLGFLTLAGGMLTVGPILLVGGYCVLLPFFLSILVSIPGWVYLSRRFGKRGPAILGVLGLGVLISIFYPILPAGRLERAVVDTLEDRRRVAARVAGSAEHDVIRRRSPATMSGCVPARGACSPWSARRRKRPSTMRRPSRSIGPV